MVLIYFLVTSFQWRLLMALFYSKYTLILDFLSSWSCDFRLLRAINMGAMMITVCNDNKPETLRHPHPTHTKRPECKRSEPWRLQYLVLTPELSFPIPRRVRLSTYMKSYHFGTKAYLEVNLVNLSIFRGHLWVIRCLWSRPHFIKHAIMTQQLSKVPFLTGFQWCNRNKAKQHN